MGDLISGVAGAASGLGDLAGAVEEMGSAAGVLGEIGGLAGDLDPESMIVDLVGQTIGPMLGINETDLGILKAAVGAATGDPLAIASGALEAVGGIASGKSPFEPVEKLADAVSPGAGS